MTESAPMKSAKRIVPLILSCLLLQSCAHTLLDTEQENWKQFAAAADAQSTRPGAVSLQVGWETPKKRLLVLARQNDEQAVLYQIDPAAGPAPGDGTKRLHCHFSNNQLYCAGPGEATPSLVAGPGTDPWAALQAHAARQIQQLNAASRAALQAQLAKQPGPRMDIARKRHPFEWGGQYETVENAQAFLETVTAQGTPFRSSWPEVPWLGSQGNAWQNENDVLKFKTMERCVTLASSASRIAVHHNHDFWAADTVSFKTAYRWQQPIDWRRLETLRMEKDGVFLHGRYTRPFQDQGLSYVSGWSPDVLTANATRFDPAKYSVAEWNIHLALPNANGLRERVLYAATYLNIMCGKG